MKLSLKIVGVVFLVTGFILTCKPELISQSPMPTDAYEAVEQRVKWGLFIGVGLFLLCHHTLKPWLQTVSAILFYLTLGFVSARFIGMVLDGFVLKQLYWLGTESIALMLFGLWYWKQRRLPAKQK